MKKELTRRDLLGRAGLALGGAVSLGVLNACDSSSDTSTPAPPPPPEPQVNQTPYRQFLPTGYQLDAAAVKQAAYDGYYAGGCCHGAYNGLMKHLADTVGAPFDKLPLDFGMFGGGGIAGYGSIGRLIVEAQGDLAKTELDVIDRANAIFDFAWSFDLLGEPLLIVRGTDGIVRGFRNACRHRGVQLAGRGRLVIPEGFREFLGVEPGGEVMVIGAALCVELWGPAAWLRYLAERMPAFHRLIAGLCACRIVQ